MERSKSIVVTANGQIGTAGNKGYIFSVTVMATGAAVGTVSLYDGTSAAATEKYRLTVPGTVHDCRTSSNLSIYCVNGLYCTLTNAVGVIEYQGF